MHSELTTLIVVIFQHRSLLIMNDYIPFIDEILSDGKNATGDVFEDR